MGDLSQVDLASAALPGQQLHDLLRVAREEPTTVRLMGQPALLVSGFADLRAFLADEEGFPGGPVYQVQVEPAVGRTFISMDGEEHLRTRQLATPAFRSRPVARFVDEQLLPLAHEVVDRFVARGSGDLVAELTNVLPFWAISRKLGLPVGSEERQRAVARGLLSHLAAPEAARRAAAAVDDVVRPVMAQRRREPGDDVLSRLLGAGLDEESVLSHVRLLYAVGATTTSDAMSSLLQLVLSRPALVDRLRADPSLVPRVVGEALRFEPPVAVLPRLSVGGGSVAGVPVSPGSLVLAALAGANRDPAVFTAPDVFDVDREESEILTFGSGPKFCPGWNLARSQLQTALTVVLERLPGVRLTAPSASQGAILRAVPALPAAWDR